MRFTTEFVLVIPVRNDGSRRHTGLHHKVNMNMDEDPADGMENERYCTYLCVIDYFIIVMKACHVTYDLVEHVT